MRAPVVSSRPIRVRGLVVLAGWTGLGLAGWVVAHRQGGARVQFAIAFAVILVAIRVALLFRVRRNEGIHRRKGPRRAVPVPPSWWVLFALAAVTVRSTLQVLLGRSSPARDRLAVPDRTLRIATPPSAEG